LARLREPGRGPGSLVRPPCQESGLPRQSRSASAADPEQAKYPPFGAVARLSKDSRGIGQMEHSVTLAPTGTSGGQRSGRLRVLPPPARGGGPGVLLAGRPSAGAACRGEIRGGIGYVSFVFLTRSGTPTGPPSPLQFNSATPAGGPASRQARRTWPCRGRGVRRARGGGGCGRARAAAGDAGPAGSAKVPGTRC